MEDKEPTPLATLHVLRKCYLELNESQARLERSDEENTRELAIDAIKKCKNVICLMGSRISSKPDEF